MRRGFRAGCVLAVLCVARAALAQSVSIDEARPAPSSQAPAPAAAKPAPPPAVPVTLPHAVSTPVEYPAAGQGEQEVVLELTISIQGTVTAASVVSGAEPFSDSALAATKTWLFEPARRSAQNVVAKIRFAVHFAPPSAAPATNAPAPAAPIVKGTPIAPPATAPMQEILVVGQREPIRETLGHAEVHDMPGAFGDPYRAIEALPGVVPIASGLPYFYVRGAPPGNVGYFFDGIPVPYLYHFAAGPGVLSPAFVDHVDLYPGAYPARYGRFAGAIVAGEMAPPSYRLHGEAT
ncbi:MAG TPA: TonB family protein, partial [Polyangiaceae bacterium]|nr:TonB family protein [Polyangiaceae bacterium]